MPLNQHVFSLLDQIEQLGELRFCFMHANGLEV
jgi:hypothetical protein